MSHILPLTATEVERRLLKVADLAVHPATASGNFIQVVLDYFIENGSEIKFKAPVDCSAVSRLQIQYVNNDGESASKNFAFADANGNDIGEVDNLFAKDAIVKVILDLDADMDGEGTGAAFVQNANTNAYIENTFVKTVNNVMPDENGNIEITVDAGVTSWNDLTDKPFGETGEVSMIKILDTNDIIGNEDIESSTIGEAPHWESYENDGRTAHSMAFYLPGELLKVGSEYVINIDGTELTAVCVEDNSDGPGAVIGDEREDAELPYYFYMGLCATSDYPANYYEIGFMGDSEPSQITIYEKDPEIVKLDPKYLPEGGVGYVTTETGIETFDIVKITNDLLENDNGYGGFETMPPEESPTGTLLIYGQLTTYELPFKLIAGQEYKVSINNISYTSTAFIRTERNEEDGEDIEYVSIGDIDEALSENFADLRFVIQYDEAYGERGLVTMINGKAFDLTEFPTEINISCPAQVEVVHKIDKKFLSQISPDWNENNPDADGYIKNRPFYVEASTNAVIENIICTTVSGDGNCYRWGFDEILPDFNIGSQYLVILDGVEYKCTCFKDSDTETTILGNLGVCDGTEGTGEPFFIYKFDNEDYGIYTREWQDVLSIYELVEEVHKIDSKFLPDDIGSNPDWNQNDEAAPDYIKNRPFYGKIIKTEVFPETLFEIEGDAVGATISDHLAFVEGKTYEVIFNGERYECVAWAGGPDATSNDPAICIGNGDLYYSPENSSSEPFACVSYSDSSCGLSVAERGKYTLKISELNEEIVKIDKKYLPDMANIGATAVQIITWSEED